MEPEFLVEEANRNRNQGEPLAQPDALKLRRNRMWKRTGDLWRVLSLPLLIFTALPLLALLIRSNPAQWLASLSQEAVRQAIGLSTSTTLVTLALTFLFGTPVAYWLAQKESFVTRLVDSLVDLPTILPPSVAGLALLMAFGRRGLAGEGLSALGIQIAFTPVAVILAQLFVASPYYIRAAAVGFARIDAELKQSAALDGANNWEIFRYVVVPLAGATLLSGGVMAWARALGEFGATIIFAGNFPGRTQTMPLAIYLGFEMNIDVALTLSVILLLCSFLTLLIVKGLLKRDWHH